MDETTENSEGSETGTASQRLLVIRGIVPRDSTAHVLGGGRAVLGREAGVTLCIDYRNVSRRHAEITREGPVFSLRDLSSTNGTYVDGRRVRHCVLRAGMVLRVGEWLGMVEELPAMDLNRGFERFAAKLYGGPVLARTFRTVRSFAATGLPIVLSGESGAGKECFARAIHELSGRSGPFHAVSCATLTSSQADAQLFGSGHGNVQAQQGHLRAAHGGTLLLDGLDELGLEVQPKLLRALELGEVVPIDETTTIRFDARIVATTQAGLDALVHSGALRRDLAARIRGAELHVLPLRERRGDIPGLFERFLVEHSGGRAPAVSARCYERLCLHDWPGNVRELQLFTRRLVALHGLEPVLRSRHVTEMLPPVTPGLEDSADAEETRREHDLKRLTLALGESAGNVKLASEMAGISRQRAYRLIKWSTDNAGRAPRSPVREKNGGRGESV